MIIMIDIFNCTWSWFWAWVGEERKEEYQNNHWQFGRIRLSLIQAIGDELGEPVLLKA